MDEEVEGGEEEDEEGVHFASSSICKKIQLMFSVQSNGSEDG